MAVNDKIDMDVFKVVTRAVWRSDNLDTMAKQMTQLLVSALDIKGAAIFALNHETEELELLASFGLSVHYLNKGPILFDQSIGRQKKNRSSSATSGNPASCNIRRPPKARESPPLFPCR